MNALGHREIAIRYEELGVLLWNIPNEVINGFTVDDFEKTIGATEAHLETLFQELREQSTGGVVVLGRSQAIIVRNALSTMLDKLGESEFQTRTGSSLEKGHGILRKLDSFIFEGVAEEVS